MIRRAVTAPLLLAAAAVGLALLVPRPRASDLAPPGFDPERIRWQELRYHATKLFVTADATVRFDPVDPAGLADDLVVAPRGRPLRSEAPRAKDTENAENAEDARRVHRLRLESRVLGRRSLEQVWFDPRTGAALQRSKLRRGGGNHYVKIQRHTRDGVFERRAEPANVDEAVGEQSTWSKVREHFIDRPAAVETACPVVLEPALLFYLLSAHPWWGEGDAFAVCVYSNGKYHRLELRAAGREAVEVDYRLGERRRYGELDALRVTLEAQPLAGADEVETFELMELEGRIELFVDPDLGAPVEIRGEMSPLGEVSVKLVGAQLRQSPSRERPFREPPPR